MYCVKIHKAHNVSWLLWVLASFSSGCESTPIVDAGVDVAPLLPPTGKPCIQDSDCTDGIECTKERCAPPFMGQRFCLIEPVHTACSDDLFCNGQERCDTLEGCVAGAINTCDDGNVCTVDRCVEEADTCTRQPRDLDLDGDPDFFCGGRDCDDADASINGALVERCMDGIDNNCNDQVDEPGCVAVPYDGCGDALEVSMEGRGDVLGSRRLVLNTRGASADAIFSCAPRRQDLAMRWVVETASSLQVYAQSTSSDVALSLRTSCDGAASDIACGAPSRNAFLGVGRLEPGTYYLWVNSATSTQVTLDIILDAPRSITDRDQCATANPVTLPYAESVWFIGAGDNEMLSCEPAGTGYDSSFPFLLTEPRDVLININSVRGERSVAVSLQNGCTGPSLICESGRVGNGTTLEHYVHSVPAGNHVVQVESSDASELQINLSTLPATAEPPGDRCTTALSLPVNEGEQVRTGDLFRRNNDVRPSCSNTAKDVIYTFTMTEARTVDIALSTPLSLGHLALSRDCPTDSSPPMLTQELSCQSGSNTMIRQDMLPAGTYFIIVETEDGRGYRLSFRAQMP